MIQPYGKDLELSNHGLLIVLQVFHDIAKTIKCAAQQRIFHRDIKPTNIVVYNEHGYLIDWGISTYGDVIPINDKFSVTLAYTSINVSSFIIYIYLCILLNFCQDANSCLLLSSGS